LVATENLSGLPSWMMVNIHQSLELNASRVVEKPIWTSL
jgi:hypothetical protein